MQGMGVKLACQPGRYCTSVGRWDMGSIQEMRWGRMLSCILAVKDEESRCNSHWNEICHANTEHPSKEELFVY